MKVRLTWYEPHEKIVEMTPKEYCTNLYAEDSQGYFPKNAERTDFNPANDDAYDELWTWLFKENAKRK